MPPSTRTTAQPYSAPANQLDPATDAGKEHSDIQDLIFLGEARPLFIRLHITIDGKPARQVWMDYVNRLFDDADHDKDGLLDKDEASQLPPLTLGTARPDVYAQAAKTDGKITRQAFFAWYEKSEAAPFTARQAQGRSRSASALFELLDTNHDGKLSLDELRAAATSLKCRDFDDDDIITEAELAPGQSPYGEGMIVFGRQGVLPPSSLVFVVQPETTPAQIAQALLDRYAKRSGDARPDSIARQDGRPPPKLFDELDTDRDGRLTAAELGRFTARTPDVQQNLALGLDRSSAEEPDRRDQGSAPDDKDAIDVRPNIYGFNVAMTGVTLEFRRRGANPGLRQTLLEQFRFEQFDTDNNGYIDADEAKASPFLAGAFKAMDRDGDGKVVKKEFEDYIVRVGAGVATRLTLEVADQGQELFDMLDQDQDGRLTLQELLAAPDAIKKYDVNGDGVLDSTEIPRRMTLTLVRGSGLPAPPNRAMGRPTRRQAVARKSDAGPLWFRKMDRNHDGLVSPREFLGPPEDFERLDTNHDGLIDVKEAEAAGTNVER